MDHTQPPPPHISPRGVWVTKLVFRILSSIFAIIIIGLAGAVVAQSSGGYSGVWFAGPIVVSGPPSAVAFVWDIAEIICILARRGRRGIHPGAIVAIDLLLWLGYLITTVFFGLFIFAWDTFEDYGYSSYYYDSYYDYDYDEAALSGMTRAILAFSALQIIVHIILFSFGCYETSIRNRSASPVIIVSGAGAAAYPAHPHQSMYGQPPMAGYAQPIMLPAGQAPPPGYIPYPYGGQPGQYPKPHEQYPPQAASPPLPEPSPVHTNSTSHRHSEWRNSYQPQYTN